MMTLFYKYLLLIITTITCFNCSIPTTHKIIEYFEDGKVKIISIFRESSVLQKIEFSDKGNVLSRSFYQDNYLFGKWTSADFFRDEDLVSDYYGNGVLKSQGYIINNILHGHWSHYNRDGSLESDRYYFYGEPIGDWYSYNHGSIDIIHYKYFKGNGSWIEYYNADLKEPDQSKLIIKEISFFHDKKLSGSYEYYYKNGNIKISGNYINGKKDGQWSHYNKLGNIIKIKNYTTGLLNGNFFLYFENGITEKLIGKYKNNKRYGTWFWFFDIDKKSSYKNNYFE